MGKKRGIPPSIPDLIKIEVKDEIDRNVLMARDRFRGALRELLHHSDEGSSADSGDESGSNEYRVTPKKIDPTYRPKQIQSQVRKMKRRRQMHMDSAFHHTYVMKLFDRSVDLAQFQEDTPLYPICRAWMANQPRNPNLVPKARSPSPDIISEFNSVGNMFDTNGEIRDINSLPPPLPSEEALPRNRIPSPIIIDKEKLDLDYEGQTLKSRELLMKEHREHWVAVRKKWHQQAHKNEQRFSESATILSTIFKRFSFIY
ncbi:PREDICTED: protein lin-37 homolog [Ceratosolen solmsi marchali]|uniref:Protein lin-37 homolog n=1 Tax=Ceratosolen solmsi marchali TaxID=326594 RepID=A0AAJ6YY16_9HYME|nr:PREDICTED: protein lin-37 homolog [Ceratosolen solmsi marchali]